MLFELLTMFMLDRLNHIVLWLLAADDDDDDDLF